MASPLSTPSLWFCLFWFVSLVAFRTPLRELATLSWKDDRYTHLALMPLISLGLIYLARKRVFSQTQYCPRVGMPLIAMGVTLFWLATRWPLSIGQDGGMALVAATVALTWIGGFVCFYGTRPFEAAIFPLCLLLLFIPIPPTWIALMEGGLQRGSAEVTHVLFRLAGTPMFREGMTFSLPGVNIEVARECSGIRSSISLLILSLALSHLFLRSKWRKLCFVLLTVPIVIFKNAVRIATISWLGVYVSRDFLYGDLHRHGGLPFSLLALALLVPSLLALQRSEAGLPRKPAREKGR